MRLGFLRRKNTDLPLFNGRRNGTRSSSPQRKVPSRKHLIIGLIVFVVLLLIFRPTSSSQPKVSTSIYKLISREKNPRLGMIDTIMHAKTSSTIDYFSLNPSPQYVQISTKTIHSGNNQRLAICHWEWMKMPIQIINISLR